jgi:hypothetical protein
VNQLRVLLFFVNDEALCLIVTEMVCCSSTNQLYSFF